jgi:hypothetical protein
MDIRRKVSQTQNTFVAQVGVGNLDFLPVHLGRAEFYE